MKKKYLFASKNNKRLYFAIIYFILLIIIIYFISFYYFINKKYFIISNLHTNINYIIPEDKEGKKVKFIDKKSINNLSISNNINNDLKKSDLKYTIQLYSNINYEDIIKYIQDILEPKSEIITYDHLFIIKINSQIGTDYFLTYKNFDSKIEASNYCKKLSFVKKCLVINAKNQ